MKKLSLAIGFVVAGLVAVNAQDTTSTQQQTEQYPTTMQGDQDRERINSRDLPDAVKRSLEQTEYRGWLVNAAYKTTGVSGNMQGDSTMQGDSANVEGQINSDTTAVSGETGAYGQEVFVVELKNGAQTKTVRFDKDGNKLDDDGDDQDQN
jgi:hypothetical protein